MDLSRCCAWFALLGLVSIRRPSKPCGSGDSGRERATVNPLTSLWQLRSTSESSDSQKIRVIRIIRGYPFWMRYLLQVSLAIVCLGPIADAEDLEIVTRPESIYVERIAGNVTQIDRVFFHIILHNTSSMPITLQWVRFELHNGDQGVLSGQYSGSALTTLFDSAIDRRRIEPTARQSLTLQ